MLDREVQESGKKRNGASTKVFEMDSLTHAHTPLQLTRPSHLLTLTRTLTLIANYRCFDLVHV